MAWRGTEQHFNQSDRPLAETPQIQPPTNNRLLSARKNTHDQTVEGSGVTMTTPEPASLGAVR